MLSFIFTFRTNAQQPLVVSPPPFPYVVAQSDVAGVNGNTGTALRGYPYAQTFTPTHNGNLYSISAGFFTTQTQLDPFYIFQFRDTTAAGLPDTTVLASVLVSTGGLVPPSADASGLVSLTADFSRFGISLQSGHEYAFSIDVPGPIGAMDDSFFWGLTGSPYSGGGSYAFGLGGIQVYDPNEDFLFTVKAVPEPSCLPMIPGLGIWFLRPRKQSRST